MFGPHTVKTSAKVQVYYECLSKVDLTHQCLNEWIYNFRWESVLVSGLNMVLTKADAAEKRNGINS